MLVASMKQKQLIAYFSQCNSHRIVTLRRSTNICMQNKIMFLMATNHFEVRFALKIWCIRAFHSTWFTSLELWCSSVIGLFRYTLSKLYSSSTKSVDTCHKINPKINAFLVMNDITRLRIEHSYLETDFMYYFASIFIFDESIRLTNDFVWIFMCLKLVTNWGMLEVKRFIFTVLQMMKRK
jgi:hypothetical protein